ncbi:MAG: TraR/DksA family transcriptional regulator [Myxococcota bacterium]
MAPRRNRESGRSEGYRNERKVGEKKARRSALLDRTLPRKAGAQHRMAGTPVGRHSRDALVPFPPADPDVDHVGRSPLGTDDRQRLRTLLHSRLKTARARAGQAASAESETAAARMTSPELAERGTDRAMEFLLMHEEARELAEASEIEAALARMRAGSYGLCASCAGRISYRRLLALPEARRCIRCEKQGRRAPR